MDTAALRELVRAHDMHWHLSTEKAVVDGQLRPIGLTITLSATHDHGMHAPSPGCVGCAEVVSALEHVVDAVLPDHGESTTFDVSIPKRQLEFPRGRRPEITATITVLHQGAGMNAPLDDSEQRCADEMVANLTSLGAHEGPG
jgi:hypothetical protein